MAIEDTREAANSKRGSNKANPADNPALPAAGVHPAAGRIKCSIEALVTVTWDEYILTRSDARGYTGL